MELVLQPVKVLGAFKVGSVPSQLHVPFRVEEDRAGNNDTGKEKDMKTIQAIGAALIAAMLMGNTMLGQSTINQRERRQQKRIGEGVKNGDLTRKEVRKLEREQVRIHAAEAKAKSDGKFSAKERARIQTRQNKASHHIYKQKHDNQERK